MNRLTSKATAIIVEFISGYSVPCCNACVLGVRVRICSFRHPARTSVRRKCERLCLPPSGRYWAKKVIGFILLNGFLVFFIVVISQGCALSNITDNKKIKGEFYNTIESWYVNRNACINLKLPPFYSKDMLLAHRLFTFKPLSAVFFERVTPEELYLRFGPSGSHYTFHDVVEDENIYHVSMRKNTDDQSENINKFIALFQERVGESAHIIQEEKLKIRGRPGSFAVYKAAHGAGVSYLVVHQIAHQKSIVTYASELHPPHAIQPDIGTIITGDFFALEDYVKSHYVYN